jgi:hypothetical protein
VSRFNYQVKMTKYGGRYRCQLKAFLTKPDLMYPKGEPGPIFTDSLLEEDLVKLLEDLRKVRWDIRHSIKKDPYYGK